MVYNQTRMLMVSRWDRIRRIVVLTVSGLILGLWASAEVQAQVTPLLASQQMGRGINLGNTLEPELEGGWNNGPAQEVYFDQIKEAGFTNVRIPIRWDKHTASSSPFTVDLAWMDRVEEVVDWALERDLWVVLNAHHENWLKQNYQSSINQARFDSIWSQVSVRFKDKSERLLFEIINEPQGMTKSEVDELNQRVLGIIRKTNTTRIVVYSGAGWASSDDLLQAAIPPDPYMMAYYHSYDPWSFAGLADGVWGSTQDRVDMRDQIQRVASWATSNQIPVMVSEFGAVRAADYNSRMRYYSVYVEELVDAKLVHQVWDDGGDFEVLQREAGTWHETKDILIHTWPDGPHGFDLEIEGDSVVALTWENPVLHDRIHIQRAIGSQPMETIATLPANSIKYLDAAGANGIQYRYRIIAENSLKGDRISHPLEIRMESSIRSSFLGSPHLIPGVIEAEDFDIGREGLTYHDSDAVNEAGAYRTDVGVDIEARLDGGFHLSHVSLGEWVEYTVDVTQAGRYVVGAEVASLQGGGRLHFGLGQAQSGRLLIPGTNSWQTTTIVSTEMDLEAGEQVFRFSIRGTPTFNVDRFTFSRVSGTTVELPVLHEVVSLYPNPVHGLLHIDFDQPHDHGLISIVDMLGRKVLTYRDLEARLELDISHLSPGVYGVIWEVESRVLHSQMILKH